jgi:hypothetical protein
MSIEMSTGVGTRHKHYPPSNGVPTSDEAAASIAGHALRQRDIIYNYIVEQDVLGSTAQEAAIALGMPIQTVTPRLLEIRKDGLLKDSGEKRLTTSRRRAIVWIDSRLNGAVEWNEMTGRLYKP